MVRQQLAACWAPGRRRRTLVLLALLLLLGLLGVDAARLDLRGPPASYLLLDRQGRFIAEVAGNGKEYGYWPVQPLPPRVVEAALALEDRHFELHPGVDPLALVRALYQNISSRKRISGASTIAMQVARLLDPGERTYWHKARETWRAVALTLFYGRDEVLSAYLRLVPYGNRVHGIAYAARRYLDKPVADLSWAEIAFLSAIPQAPTLMNPFHEEGRQRAIARGGRILKQLRDNAVLSAAEFEMAHQQIRDIRLPTIPIRPSYSLHAAFKLQQMLAGTPRSGAEPYRIVTTLDLDIQESVAQLAGAAIGEWQSRGAGNAAVILLDRKSNGVLAWLGSTDYFAQDQAGALDYAQTPRSPGSTLKPFIYALAFDRGKITPATILDDLPAVSEGIVNADKSYLGPLLPRQALANSRNVPVANLLNDIGLEEGYAFLHELALHDNTRDAREYGLGLVIGAMPVTLEHLVQAYSVLANDGQWRSLNWYDKQVGTTRQLLSPATARLVTLHLADPVARLPSFPRMGSTEFSFPVALKTGTSQGLRDAWAVAYSTRYLLGVWVGHPDARPMREITGASSAAELAKRILNHLHAGERHGLTDLSFPHPDGYRHVALCALSGKRATPACDLVFDEWFRPGQEPLDDDDVHLRLAVDVRNGLLAHAGTPKRYVEQRNFVSLPPRYADWAAQAGLPHAPGDVSPLGEKSATLVRQRAPANFGIAREDAKSALRIVSPSNGLKLLRDPTVPAAHNTIALQVEVEPPLREMLWLVDGKPFRLAPYPYTVRWPLQVGDHVIQARSTLSTEMSAPVNIHVE
jgi:penicillin-binding protein 1C